MTKRGLNCGGCERHNTVNDVVLCNKCKKWFHYGCVGVTAGIMSQAWWCDLCAIQVDNGEAKEKRHPKTPMEAIAKTKKPAESCDGENKANRAASCEGEASVYKLSIGVVNTILPAAKMPPSTKAFTRASSKRSKEVAMAQLLKKQ